MSLNSFTISNNIPFFPPGIASHKTMSSLKKPQNVKQCKKISQNREGKSKSGLISTKQISTSTPNIKSSISSTNLISEIPKHHCDMGLLDIGTFKATPLPRYYSPDSLERNRCLFEQLNPNYKTQSLDRVTAKAISMDQMSLKSKSKTLANFHPEKPFYPPSKYPNIHDKGNVNLQRFLETREQYKTPASRRSLRYAKNRSNPFRPKDISTNTSKIGGSVPNLNSKNLKDASKLNKKKKSDKIHSSLKMPDKSFLRKNKNSNDFSPEIGLYRKHDKLDLQDEFGSCIPKEMSSSFFYPKPIPNSFYLDDNDKMAKSLYNETSLASKIHTGSLERASRTNYYQSNGNQIEINNQDDSPSKSSSPIKQGNSFSQDSLDGNKKSKNQNNVNSEKSENETADSIIEGEKSYNSNSEEESQISDSKTYKFSNFAEDDYSLTKTENQNKYLNSLSTISEREKTSEDQKNSTIIDQFHSFEDNPALNKNINPKNPFNYSEGINNEDVKNDHNSVFSTSDENHINSNNPFNPFQKTSINSTISDNENIFNVHKDGLYHDNSFEKRKNPLLEQYNLDRYLTQETDYDGIKFNNYDTGPGSYSMHDYQNENRVSNVLPNDQLLLNEIASKCIVSTDQKFNNSRQFKKELCYCVNNARIGESCVKCSGNSQDLQKTQDIDSTISTVYSSMNTQVSGLDYDMPDIGCNSHLPDQGFRTSQVPRIEIYSDTRSAEESSENESSLTGSDDLSYMRYDNNSVHLPNHGSPWVSSPELTIARSDIVTRRNRRHLQSENPLKPLCNVCFKPAYFMERVSINNIIFHKMCFLCRKCYTHLSFNNCVLYHRKPYCLVHARPKVSKPLRSASASKLSQIKERLDSRNNLIKQSSMETKQPKRVFYGGIKSAKEKFLQEKDTVQNPVAKPQKRFTPPRQGVTAGVVESEPAPRDPNIITSGDDVNEDINRLIQGNTTKDKLARFKEIQQRSFEKDLVNGSDGYQKPDVIPVDTKSLRNKFLSGANETDSENKPRKLNPSEEIQELARKSSNAVFENEPLVRTDVIKSDQNIQDESLLVSKNKAKELKEMFTNYATEDKSRKTEKFTMEIGEGGIYESNPQERHDDVIPYQGEKDLNLPNDSVKSGLQKIKELQNLKSKDYQKSNTEPIKLDMDINHSGIYENNPAESQADIQSYQNEDYLANIREKKVANDAKRAFLEKQKQEEESRLKRNTPQMIDIWKDLCPDSGVFENQPKAQDKDVLRHDDKMNEELLVDDVDKQNEENIIHNGDETREKLDLN